MGYQKLIHDIDPTVNPAGVEASMRLQFGTLDHLDRQTFREEIILAKECEREQPGYLRRTAASYGMEADYNKWEESAGEPPTPQGAPAWTGERITNRLQIWPSEEHPGMWELSGKEPHLSGLGTPQDMVRLAHTILAHFPEPTDQ